MALYVFNELFYFPLYSKFLLQFIHYRKVNRFNGKAKSCFIFDVEFFNCDEGNFKLIVNEQWLLKYFI